MARLVSGNKIVYRLFDKDGKLFAVAESSKSTMNKCLEELQKDLKPYKIQTEKRSVTYRIKSDN